ncbi:hypothetical protein [Rhodococcus sp. IEGM 1330]|uniref:hypothetical protein n=1 Tax=Rhodococcus sp. IEGM 1330 TaxID=3082225 RepID=UPI002954FB0D|nr:hypothetical protein [Rhodococcus sp. IEGM 1330]MDV8021370.1 hypothetical protein [Rhodococcus sp. IEGM 1330]
MYDGPEFQYVLSIRDERGGSAPGDITCFYDGVPIGCFTFEVHESEKVVQTLMLQNHGFGKDNEDLRRPGLGMEIFRQLMAKFPGYEIRVSGDVSGMLKEGREFIAAVRRGNPEKGRPPWPYHEYECFRSGRDCQCVLGGRRRST